MRITRFLAAGAAAAIAVAGCGSGASPAAQQAQHVTIAGTATLRFSPMIVHVRPGAVRVTLADMGAYPHNIVIPALRFISGTVTGDPGSGTVSFTVTFPRAGRYAFHCEYHLSAGMTGVFVVA
jgi:plastocyanin